MNSNCILLIMSSLFFSTTDCSSNQDKNFFSKIKETVSNGAGYIKTKVSSFASSKKSGDALYDIESKVTSDFQSLEQEAKREIAVSKENFKRAEKKAEDLIDIQTEESKKYFEEQKEKINYRWSTLHKKIINITEKLSSIQSKFNQTITAINLMDLLDKKTEALKPSTTTKKAKNDIQASKDYLNSMKDTTYKIYDEIEEELDDLLEELNKYETKLEVRSGNADQKTRAAIGTFKNAARNSFLK